MSRGEKWFFRVRLLVAVVLIGAAFKIGAYIVRNTYYLEGAVPLVMAMALLVTGVAVIAPEVIKWGSSPVTFYFSNLFFPATRAATAPPDYTLAHYYRKHWRYEEALFWYRDLIRQHPQELIAHLEVIELAFEKGDESLAASLARKAKRKLHSPVAREEVAKTLQAMQTRRHGPKKMVLRHST